MSDYVYESGMSTKRRRQRRTAITMLLTLLLLFGAFWWAWSYMRDGGSATATPTQTNTLTPGACVDAKDATFNVYNATNRAGLARTAADALKAAGFTVDKVANDPLSKSLPGGIEIRYGEPGHPYATSFKEYYGQPVSIAPDDREDASVDVVLGDTFQGWAAWPETPPC